MMNLKLYGVGDFVTIVNDIHRGRDYKVYVNDDMEKYAGSTHRIESVSSVGGKILYSLEDTYGWDWTDDMFVETYMCVEEIEDDAEVDIECLLI